MYFSVLVYLNQQLPHVKEAINATYIVCKKISINQSLYIFEHCKENIKFVFNCNIDRVTKKTDIYTNHSNQSKFSKN